METMKIWSNSEDWGTNNELKMEGSKHWGAIIFVICFIFSILRLRSAKLILFNGALTGPGSRLPYFERQELSTTIPTHTYC
jgi:hypothetical protein